MKRKIRNKTLFGICSTFIITGAMLFIVLKFVHVDLIRMKDVAKLTVLVMPSTSDKSAINVRNETIARSVTIRDPPANLNADSKTPKAIPQIEAPDPSLDMELYLRMTTARQNLPQMYESILIQSMTYLWPENVSMVVVLDEERKQDHDYGDTIKEVFPYPRICYMEENKVTRFWGRDRMQRDMFYPEQCTMKKYVAFVDTDTMFITRVIPKLLFSNGKPIVVGIYGNLLNQNSMLLSMSTVNIFKTKEVMRCRSNFPVIVKVEHLIKLRKHVEKLHNMTFEEAVFTNKATVFSQFNLMCQYIWTFHRDEYEFRLSLQTQKGVALKSANQREDKAYYDKILTVEQKRPYARVALHYKYIVNANWKNEKTWIYLLKASICYVGGFHVCPDKCAHFDRNAVRPEMFIFEGIDWSWDKRCLQTQQNHYEQVAAYNSSWYTDIIKRACMEVDALKWILKV